MTFEPERPAETSTKIAGHEDGWKFARVGTMVAWEAANEVAASSSISSQLHAGQRLID